MDLQKMAEGSLTAKKGSFMKIGSIYEIDPRTAADAASCHACDFKPGEIKKYNKKYSSFTASGREAIALAIKSIEANRPGIKKVCLLPAYMCDSVFFPFKRAGWKLNFYHLQKNLEADKENLFAQIESVRPGVLFIHPYYGMDTCKSLRPFFQTWQSQGICIMEDATQSYYLENASWEADYIIGSLRKWFPIPDGGFAASNDPLPDETLPENRKFTEEKLALLTQKWNYLHDTGSLEEKESLNNSFLSKNRALEKWLDDYDGISALSKESMKILSALNEEACRDRRNANYRYLRKWLGESTQFMPVPFEQNNVSTSAAPLYFPIYAKDRDALQRFLASRDIFAPVLWPVGKENENCLTQEEHEIYEHLLALPMDQRYGQEEMQQIVEVLAQFTQYKQYKQNSLPNVQLPPNNAPRADAVPKPELIRQPEQKPDGESEPELIAIRADANEFIATGHIMRCITIARQLQAKGRRVLFFTADEYPSSMLKQAGMEFVCLHTPWDQMEEETAILSGELTACGCRKLLVDSYQVTENYFNSLKTLCQITYIDDCFDAVYPVDMIINYNPYHVRFPYPEAYKGKAKLLLGTAYVPLREEFQRLPDSDTSPQKEPGSGRHILVSSGGDRHVLAGRHILVSSGGGDPHDALLSILSEAAARTECSRNIFHVIVGGFHKNIEKLELLAREHSNIRLHYHVTHMAELMRQCDIAISAAGTMLFELCALQIPSIFYVCADNQQYDSDFFAEEGRMLFSGDIRTSREECINSILKNMELLLNDKEMQQQMKHRLHEVTDGKGAGRIAEEIIRLS